MGATCLACVCRACVWASVYIRVFIVGRISFTLRPNPHHDLPCLFSPGKYKRFLSPSFASLYLPLNFLYCYLLSLQLVVDNEQFKKAVRLTVCCCSKQILRLSHLFAFARARKDQNRHIFPSHRANRHHISTSYVARREISRDQGHYRSLLLLRSWCLRRPFWRLPTSPTGRPSPS